MATPLSSCHDGSVAERLLAQADAVIADAYGVMVGIAPNGATEPPPQWTQEALGRHAARNAKEST